MMRKYFSCLTFLAIATATSAANAAIDVSSTTSAISDAGVAVATVGGAALLVFIGIKVYHWIRRAA